MNGPLPASPRRAAPGAVAPLLLLLLLPALLLPASGCGRKPTTVRVTPGKLVLYGVKKSAVVRAEVLDGKGAPLEEVSVSFEVDAPKVATVDKGGKVTSVAPGKARLTARSGELSATVAVQVVDAATVAVTPARMTLAGPKGTTGRFLAVLSSADGKPVDIPLTWSSSDPKVATVDPSGLVTSVSEGRAGISATVGDLAGTSDLAVVYREVATFEVGPATIPLRAGDSARVGVVARDPSGAAIEDVAVEWTSADPRTATVVGGTVRGVSPGSTTVRATSGRHRAEVSVLVF